MSGNFLNSIDLSTLSLDLAFCVGETFSLERYASNEKNWLHSSIPSGLFALYLENKRIDSTNLSLQDRRVAINNLRPGRRECHATMIADGLSIQHHLHVYNDSALIEQWQTISNTGMDTIKITRLDSFSLNIPGDMYTLSSFNSDWGQEFEPRERMLDSSHIVILETRAGRSSKGMHPWFSLTTTNGKVLTGSVAWSGNWILRFEPLADGFHLSGGLSDWAFAIELPPGSAIQTPKIILATGPNLNATAQQYVRIGRKYWYPRNTLSAAVPVEWNHWWSYEDADISDPVFRHNGSIAAELGIELCTLDAGWFGPSDDTYWHHVRGDWELVNARRFPNGIRAVADDIHARGMKFGLWCEIEGLGSQARLAIDHPQFPALCDGAQLGYVCFGNPVVQEWAYQTLCRLITEYNCDWLKLDFNVDPGCGCNRTDHGHGNGDGLYRHVNGYYQVLDRVRAAFPEVILENCSSGGLRIDLEMARHTHCTFSSDPDWPVHALQVFWGISLILAPEVILRWSYSEWRIPSPTQQFDPRNQTLEPHQFDYFVRIAMLSLCGFSQKLPDLPDWAADRLAQHIATYKRHIRRFVRNAVLTRLTDQPQRNGNGERWAAFQYGAPDQSEYLVFVFRLPDASPTKTIFLKDLEPDQDYQIESLGIEHNPVESLNGAVLMQRGMQFTTLNEQDSALLWIHKTP